MLRITVPSQRKVDGHVRYKIELRRDAELVNAPCEKRFSEIHALKDEVKAALGETLYHKAFGESGHAFPSKWAQNPAEKLQGWLQNLVRLLATSRNSSRGATFENRALDFLCTTRDAAFPRPPPAVAPPAAAAAAAAAAPTAAPTAAPAACLLYTSPSPRD